MRSGSTSRPQGLVVATALTWDGSRISVRELPVAALQFLGPAAKRLPDLASLGALFAQEGILEIRICWVPRLGGGESVLAGTFHAPNRMRLAFHASKTVILGGIFGVVYHRSHPRAAVFNF